MISVLIRVQNLDLIFRQYELRLVMVYRHIFAFVNRALRELFLFSLQIEMILIF